MARACRGTCVVSTWNCFFGSSRLFFLFALVCLFFLTHYSERYSNKPPSHLFASSCLLTVHMLMMNMNLFAVLMVGVALVATGQIWDAVSFIQAHPPVLPQTIFFSFLSAMGQNFVPACARVTRAPSRIRVHRLLGGHVAPALGCLHPHPTTCVVTLFVPILPW